MNDSPNKFKFEKINETYSFYIKEHDDSFDVVSLSEEIGYGMDDGDQIVLIKDDGDILLVKKEHLKYIIKNEHLKHIIKKDN